MYSDSQFPDKKLKTILETLQEGLEFISQYEKLSRNEGQVKIVYGVNGEVGIEVFSPHLIPNSLSYTWMSKDFDSALNNCLKDLRLWVDIEKDAPRERFSIDSY